MLPLIMPTLPQVSVSQPAGLATGLVSPGAQPTAQQITAVAVPGTGAPSPYNSQTPQQRAAGVAPRLPGAQPERAAILPDPEFWKVPTREANPPLQATAQTPMPIQVNLPQVSQFTAQVIAQQLPARPTDLPNEEEALPVPRRDTSLPGKKPSLGDAIGTHAYAIAASRLQTADMPEPVDALS